MRYRAIPIWTAAACMLLPVPGAFAASLEKGGCAEVPAAQAYAFWMQFAEPDENTPAIDRDGCLNYALAKLAVRYNLPVPGADSLSDSYTFYTAFVQEVLLSGMPKMERVAEVYSDYLQREESIWLSGTAEERAEQAYAVCAAAGNDRAYSYVLEMKTGSGSDHYVLTDRVDLEQHRLYLLDSGSRYVSYLGDSKTQEKGYTVTAVHPFHIQTVPGDCNGDFQLTASDAVQLLEGGQTANLLQADANHDGTADAKDAVYAARVAFYTQRQQVQYTSVPPAADAEETAKKQPPVQEPGGWNSAIFENQLLPASSKCQKS